MSDNPAPATEVPYQTVVAPPSEPASPQSGGGGLLAMIERLASNPQLNIDVFDRLLAARRQEEDRRAKQAFDNAIALAKGEIPPIVKNREVRFETKGPGGKTSYRHEDFAAVAAAIDPVLARHGLSYRFRTKQDGAKLIVTCIVSHRDGYSEETTLEAANDTSGSKNPIQSVGSAATYLSRYSLKLALGLAASNDDDGQSAAAEGAIGTDEIAYVEQLVRDTGSDPAKFLAALKAESIEALTMSQYRRAIELLNQKKRKLTAGGINADTTRL